MEPAIVEGQSISQFLQNCPLHATQEDLRQFLKPYLAHEDSLRTPKDGQWKKSHLVSVFDDLAKLPITSARNSPPDNRHHLFPLLAHVRRDSGSPATVRSYDDYKNNFSLFSDSRFSDWTEEDWQNVVVAGGAAMLPLMPLDATEEQGRTDDLHLTACNKGDYYLQKAPASDIDLFIYGLDQDAAIGKLKHIEATLRKSMFERTSCTHLVVRTANAVTLVSNFPFRHIQIVLRAYQSISEILTGFDVDCSAVAYDGTHVWASPRALVAFMTQTNIVNLERRSPSYESRLAKYAKQGFEAYWPELKRDEINPLIYEAPRSELSGLARLLSLEAFPVAQHRCHYQEKRSIDRGNVVYPENHYQAYDWKQRNTPAISDWENTAVSNYESFSLPFGPRVQRADVVKHLTKLDWISYWKPSETGYPQNSHRHPAFWGTIDRVLRHCCSGCADVEPSRSDDGGESPTRRFVSGQLKFLCANPGRQSVGSFHPLSAAGWTSNAYVGHSRRLGEAIRTNNLTQIKEIVDACSKDDNPLNRPIFTGQMPLQIAVRQSAPDTVTFLIEQGADVNINETGLPGAKSPEPLLQAAILRGSVDILTSVLGNEQVKTDKAALKRCLWLAYAAEKRYLVFMLITVLNHRVSHRVDHIVDHIVDHGVNHRVDHREESLMVYDAMQEVKRAPTSGQTRPADDSLEEDSLEEDSLEEDSLEDDPLEDDPLEHDPFDDAPSSNSTGHNYQGPSLCQEIEATRLRSPWARNPIYPASAEQCDRLDRNGDYDAHALIRQGNRSGLEECINMYPQTLGYENINGMSPAELAERMFWPKFLAALNCGGSDNFGKFGVLGELRRLYDIYEACVEQAGRHRGTTRKPVALEDVQKNVHEQLSAAKDCTLEYTAAE